MKHNNVKKPLSLSINQSKEKDLGLDMGKRERII